MRNREYDDDEHSFHDEKLDDLDKINKRGSYYLPINNRDTKESTVDDDFDDASSKIFNPNMKFICVFLLLLLI